MYTNIDDRIVESFYLLYGEVKGKRLLSTISMLTYTAVYSELEENIITYISDSDIGTSDMMSNIEDSVLNSCLDYLQHKGIKLYTDDSMLVNTILNSLIELSKVNKIKADELLPIMYNDEDDEMLMFSKLIEYFSNISYLEVFDVLVYVKTSLIKDAKLALEHISEDIDYVDGTFDPITNNSYLYNTFIIENNIKVDYDSIMSEYIKLLSFISDTDTLAKELYVVVKYSKNIDNEVYLITATIKEELSDLYIDDSSKLLMLDNVLNKTLQLIKG